MDRIYCRAFNEARGEQSIDINGKDQDLSAITVFHERLMKVMDECVHVNTRRNWKSEQMDPSAACAINN
jgi:hypothetical protein